MTGIKKGFCFGKIWKRIRSRFLGRMLCAVAAAALAGCGAVYLYFHSPYEYPLPCMWYLLTGFYCPGCGAGRACYFLLHGKVMQAFSYNPLMVILLPFFCLYAAARTVDWVMTGENHIDGKMNIKMLAGILIIIFLYGVIRNIPVFPFTLLAPGGWGRI